MWSGSNMTQLPPVQFCISIGKSTGKAAFFYTMKTRSGTSTATPTEMLHYHHCPKCYEAKPCHSYCTIEPDLDDPVSHPGKQFGAHCECDECHNEETLYTKEWWDIYHGFKKRKS